MVEPTISETGEENLEWGPEPVAEESSEDTPAALLNEMADLGRCSWQMMTLPQRALKRRMRRLSWNRPQDSVPEDTADAPSDGFAETLDWGEEPVDEAPATAAEAPVQEISVDDSVVEPAVAESVATPETESPAATPDDSAVLPAAMEQVDEFNMDDSEFLSGVEELQAMAELSFSDGETGPKLMNLQTFVIGEMKLQP